MKRKGLAREVARTADFAPAEAQDRVDEMVHEILQKLRSGEPMQIERLGKLAARPVGGK
jgi:nucleoid DNA-binding protein